MHFYQANEIQMTTKLSTGYNYMQWIETFEHERRALIQGRHLFDNPLFRVGDNLRVCTLGDNLRVGTQSGYHSMNIFIYGELMDIMFLT